MLSLNWEHPLKKNFSLQVFSTWIRFWRSKFTWSWILITWQSSGANKQISADSVFVMYLCKWRKTEHEWVQVGKAHSHFKLSSLIIYDFVPHIKFHGNILRNISPGNTLCQSSYFPKQKRNFNILLSVQTAPYLLIIYPPFQNVLLKGGNINKWPMTNRWLKWPHWVGYVTIMIHWASQ